MRSLRWAAPAALVSAVLALSACGGGMNATPAGPGLNGVSGAMHAGQQKHITIIDVHPAGKTLPSCNTSEFPAGCVDYSRRNASLQIELCYGPASNPCENTSEITNWQGGVISTKTGKKTKGIVARWTGPFPCDVNSYCDPPYSYELDTLYNDYPLRPKLTRQYPDEQIPQGCISSSCFTMSAIGIFVVK